MKYFRAEDGKIWAAPQASASLPKNAVELTDAEALEHLNPVSPDYALVNGAWVPSAAKAQALLVETRASRLAVLRQAREVILNRLMGMAVSAVLAGDNATAKACQEAKRALLDVTKHAEVVAASSLAELDSALTDCQRAISDTLPASARAAFAGLQL